MRLKWAERGIVFVLATYVGLYVSLLQPDIFIPCSLNSHFQMHLRAPRYRVGGTAAEIAFRPLSYLDRKIRPHYWASQQPLPGMTVDEANAATVRDQRGGFGGSIPTDSK